MSKVFVYWLVLTLINAAMIVWGVAGHPPYIGKGERWKNKDSIIIYSMDLRYRHNGGYVDHVFLRRKNGKYRYHPTIFDAFLALFPLIVFGGLLVGLWDYEKFKISESPEFGIILFALIVSAFVELYVVINLSTISALIYFKKHGHKV